MLLDLSLYKTPCASDLVAIEHFTQQITFQIRTYNHFLLVQVSQFILERTISDVKESIYLLIKGSLFDMT